MVPVSIWVSVVVVLDDIINPFKPWSTHLAHVADNSLLLLHEKFWLDLAYKIKIRGSSPYSFILLNFSIHFTLLELYDEFVKKAILKTSHREMGYRWYYH